MVKDKREFSPMPFEACKLTPKNRSEYCRKSRQAQREIEREGKREREAQMRLSNEKCQRPKQCEKWELKMANSKLEYGKRKAEHRREKRREKLKNWRCKCCGKCEAAAKDASLRMRQHGQFIHNMRRQTDSQCIGAIKCIWHRCCICIYENRKFDYATAASGKRQGACGKCNSGSRRPKLSKFKPGGNHERQQQ